MINTKKIAEYNTPETVAIIASFPARKNRSIAAIDAVASYCDHLAGAFGRELNTRGRKLVILVQKTGAKEEFYTEGKNLIARVWEKGTPLSYISLIKTLKSRFPKVKTVIVQFEFHQFGGNATTGTFPLFLAALKIMGIKTTLVMHQVVEDISSLSGHVDLNPGSIKSNFFNLALRWFYRAAGFTAQKVVVHNQVLADRLARITGRTDTVIVPHGLGAIRSRISQKTARAKLGFKKDDFIIMSFGFLAWYKGTDWLTRTFTKLKMPKTKLLIAGGTSPNLAGKPHYDHFVKKVENTAKKSRDVKISGFIEDRDLPTYFAACDLVVLPYRTLMSSSGPLAMTVSFRKPFILSKALAPYLKDADFRQALESNKLSEKKFIFDLSKTSFLETVNTFRNNSTAYTNLSRDLYRTRNWQTVAAALADTVSETDLASRPLSAIMMDKIHSYVPSLAPVKNY